MDLYSNCDADNTTLSSFSQENSGSLGDLFSIFCLKNLQSTFPTLYVLLHLAITLPVSSCNVERSFSKLKLVKTKLRTTITEERLENLMRISYEQDVDIDNEKIINLFAQKSNVLSKALLF